MPRWLKWTLRVLVVLLVLAAGAYWWLLMQSGSPDSSFTIDMDELCRLSNSLPGERPSEIRVEQIGVLKFPAIAIMAGDGWQTDTMEVFSYQLVFPGRSAIIDTGFDRKTAEALNASSFDDEAYRRMSAGLTKATFIVVTHEHPDHLGGLVAQPNLKALLEHAMLTTEQVENSKGLKPAAFPPGTSIIRIGYERYDGSCPAWC